MSETSKRVASDEDAESSSGETTDAERVCEEEERIAIQEESRGVYNGLESTFPPTDEEGRGQPAPGSGEA